jgi:mannitol-1-phosphate/altronate dehydrogenase
MLHDASLRRLSRTAAVPRYDRRGLQPGVVHLGVGGFHRAHQAVYLDDLAAADPRWGVTGVSLRRPAMRDALTPQDGLYTVLERGEGGERARVVGVLRRTLFAPAQERAVLSALADPRMRLVTLTVTGDGYGTGEGSAAWWIVEALARRRAAGTDPFAVLSCDNIPDSGAAARSAVLACASDRDELLARWIEANVGFPGGMVDRITPETTADDRRHVASAYGIADRWPVITEPFRQWVVEDAFGPAGRPPLEAAGVVLVSDVAPYRLAKTRLLNGGHSALGYLGTLAGHTRTDEAMADPVVGAYLERLWAEEIAPLLPAAPGLDLAAYRCTLAERLANPAIADPLARLCGRGSTKLPAYLLPSLREALAEGRPSRLLTFAVAAWMRWLRGSDLAGRPVEVRDAHAARLQALAQEGGDDPRPLLSARDVFGDLGDRPGFVVALGDALVALDRHGPGAALARQPVDELVAA